MSPPLSSVVVAGAALLGAITATQVVTAGPASAQIVDPPPGSETRECRNAKQVLSSLQRLPEPRENFWKRVRSAAIRVAQSRVDRVC